MFLLLLLFLIEGKSEKEKETFENNLIIASFEINNIEDGANVSFIIVGVICRYKKFDFQQINRIDRCGIRYTERAFTQHYCWGCSSFFSLTILYLNKIISKYFIRLSLFVDNKSCNHCIIIIFVIKEVLKRTEINLLSTVIIFEM